MVDRQSHIVVNTASASLQLDADVLVLGGGPAGTWAACAAAGAGAKVVLADKGYCGASGATAAASTGVWYVEPDEQKRLAAMESREKLGGYLQDRRWMSRVLVRTFESVSLIEEMGYPFPTDDDGRPHRNNLRGPDYMRIMRARAKQLGVTILDHSPALELLVDDDGAVAGARGLRRQKSDAWIVRAKAVVIATGGCAFMSKALGCNVLTGDGYLMAAELGAELSGMEFSNAYGIAPKGSSVTKTRFYSWGTFTYEDGTTIPGAASHAGRSVIARTLLEQPVYFQIDSHHAPLKEVMRRAQPNFFLPLDRIGIDPFTQRFQVTLRLEGTVRGTGGLRITDYTCATSVAGLYAAGDAATRELVCGGFTGGGSHNAAWAMSSGFWAGSGAADYALQAAGQRASSTIRSPNGAALRTDGVDPYDGNKVTRAVQAEVFPYETNYFRSAPKLSAALERLDALWSDVSSRRQGSIEGVLKAREAASMTATARWMYRSALARTESRGMARRADFAKLDPAQRHHIISSGLDEVVTRTVAASPRALEEIAA
jgi:succinate dehydrogenase/fumarate reductase flavoprotein subunit